jgi:Putative Actinobacterial Holin-X, holin superfamily III
MSDGQDRLLTGAASPVTTPGPAAPAAPTTPALGDDWPAQATAQIVKTVDLVRSKTTEPAITVARGVVYGLLAAILGVASIVVLSILLIRFVDIWVPGDVYWAYLIVGGVFFLAGIVCWSQRSRRPRAEGE